MPQILSSRWNALLPAGLLAAPLILIGLGWLGIQTTRWSQSRSNEPVEQPIAFDHRHHVGLLGLDCRYCHTSVERSAFAGMPATEICMQCHTEIWVGRHGIQQVQASFRTGVPIGWLRVHNLEDFSYFDHSIHVAKGIGCVTCHGRIDEMAVTRQMESLEMQWCLDCHRQPEQYVRPRDEVFNLSWTPPADEQGWQDLATRLDIEPVSNRQDLGHALVEKYDIRRRTSCSACHR